MQLFVSFGLPDEELSEELAWRVRAMPRPAAWLRALEAEVLTGPKEKAVGYYLDHGRCIASTIKTLGYPARDSLRAWIHELHPELHTRVVGRSDGLARPPAMKQAAVIALCTRQESANAVAQKLGVCRPTLYN